MRFTRIPFTDICNGYRHVYGVVYGYLNVYYPGYIIPNSHMDTDSLG